MLSINLLSFRTLAPVVSEEFNFEIDQSEAKIASEGHLVQSNGTKSGSFVEVLPFIIPAKFG